MRLIGWLLLLLIVVTPDTLQAQFTGNLDEVQTSVSIITEADTIVPPYYQGRSEPTIGSQIRLHAVVSGNSNPATLSYQWFVNNQAVTSEPEEGRQTITTTVPLTKNLLVGVRVYEGTAVLAEVFTEIAISDPELHIYEINPLRGAARTAVDEEYILLGTEATFAASLYFGSSLDNTLTGIEWLLDNKVVDTAEPLLLTLAPTDENSGRTKVSVMYRDLDTFAYRLDKHFFVIY